VRLVVIECMDCEVLNRDLGTLVVKHGAFTSSTALDETRRTDNSNVHDAFLGEARQRLGDQAGTRALIGVLLLECTMPRLPVVEVMRRALKVGSLDAGVVATATNTDACAG
jgi:hypothetical protein